MEQTQVAGTLNEERPPRPKVDVLVVDDHDDLRRSVIDILGQSGYTTAEAEDGLVALEVLQQTDVGVMIVDIRMPRLDGVGLIDALDHPPPIILVSAHSREEASRVEAKIARYLQKPIQPRTLLEAVGRALLGNPT